MAIWNLGSINADIFYDLPHIPAPGETLAALGMRKGLGGKGANLSVAAARAGSVAHHIGAVGEDGLWARDRLLEYGVDTRFITQSDVATGHAIINVASDGENAIVIFPGANAQIPMDGIEQALSQAMTGDIFVTQNETNAQVEAARVARSLGLRVAYAAAPFDVEAARAMLDHTDILFMNEVEAAQLTETTDLALTDLPVADVIVTLGAKGSRHIAPNTKEITEHPVVPTEVVDTTGAGDTFTGYVLAGLDRGFTIGQAMRQATFAGSLMVSRLGTADVIPDLAEVEAAMGSGSL